MNHPAVTYVPASTDADLLPVVDDHDNYVQALPRREVHLRRLKHRAVHIVVVNSKDEILLQRRSMKKDNYPGWWDISVGGHVDVGEEYDQAARRELREEQGIAGAPLAEVARIEAQERTGWEFVRVYECRHDGDVQPNADEVSEVRWVPARLVLEQFGEDAPTADHRLTGSGSNSIRTWARATGRL